MSVVLAALCSGVVGVLGIPFFNWICLHSIESLFLFTRCSVVLKYCMKEALTHVCILLGSSGILSTEPQLLRHGHSKLELWAQKCLCSQQ